MKTSCLLGVLILNRISCGKRVPSEHWRVLRPGNTAQTSHRGNSSSLSAKEEALLL